MTLYNKTITFGRFTLRLAVARTPVKSGATRYSQRIELKVDA